MKRQFQNCDLFTKETLFRCTDWILMEMTLISMPQECVTDVIQWWKKSLRTKDVNIPDNVSQQVTTDSFWSLHTEQSCSVCTHYVAQDKEGRPAKDRWLKKRQREASASFDPPDCSTPPKTKRVSCRCSNISIPIKNVANSPGCRCYGPDTKDLVLLIAKHLQSNSCSLKASHEWHSW